MEGKSHVGTALTWSVTIVNGVYLVLPRPLARAAELILHSTGTPLTPQHLIALIQNQQVLSFDSLSSLTRQFTFLLFVILCARLPDRLERRKLDVVTGVPVKHRGFTHSFFLLFCLVMFFLSGYFVVCLYLQHHHPALDPLLTQEPLVLFAGQEIVAIFLGLFFGMALHILGDSLTTMGVRVWWPDSSFHWLLPKSMRFSNGRWPEYLIVWGSIAIVAALIALGKFGL